MAGILGVFVAAIAVGALFPRRWIVPVPFVIAALWVVYAAGQGGEDGDGMPLWQIAAFLGTILAASAALGLSAGTIVGRYLRERSLSRRLPPSSQ